jgi:hypothetical protein
MISELGVAPIRVNWASAVATDLAGHVREMQARDNLE